MEIDEIFGHDRFFRDPVTGEGLLASPFGVSPAPSSHIGEAECTQADILVQFTSITEIFPYSYSAVSQFWYATIRDRPMTTMVGRIHPGRWLVAEPEPSGFDDKI